MRVISGTARGKKLVSLEGLNTRPTLDRVKEALFNIIQFNIADKNVLDLFAGSGAIGIEAISRGAKSATFCDNSIDAIKIIQTNIKNTRSTDKAIVLHKDYSLALKDLAKKGNKFDIIYLDPPYKTDFANKAIEEIIKLDISITPFFISKFFQFISKEKLLRSAVVFVLGFFLPENGYFFFYFFRPCRCFIRNNRRM